MYANPNTINLSEYCFSEFQQANKRQEMYLNKK